MRNFTTEEEKEVIRLYVEEGRGQMYCAKTALGVGNPRYVKAILNKYNIHIRGKKEATILTNKNRSIYKKDETFFQKESPDMAWILGFLASDGTVRKDSNEIKIGLAIKDKEILEKIRQVMHIEEIPIKEYTTNNGYEACSLKWTCEQHKKDLANYSIIPAKTFRLKPPYKLNRKYWIDYIRGYFDGDGSINLVKNSNGRGNGNLRWQICSAKKEILQWIIDFFYEEYQIPKVNILTQQRKLHPLYYFQYSSSATRKIYKILYTENSLYLKRKKDKFEEILLKVKEL